MKDERDMPGARRAIEYVATRPLIYFAAAMALLSVVLMNVGVFVLGGLSEESAAELPDWFVLVFLGGFGLACPWLMAIHFARHLLLSIKALEKANEELRSKVDSLIDKAG